jgi:zinc-binding alcohol dehydrogenase/oxidoreductase
MRALSLSEINQAPQLVDLESPQRGPDEVRVRLSHAALNRRDVWITKGQYPKIQTPVVLGSDGVGTLCDDTDTIKSGTRVVIYPSLYWGDNPRVQSHKYEILGMPRQGTLAEEICIPKSCVFEAPPHLSGPEAAALPLAGLTAWRALFTRGQLEKNQRILITGIGGGVASVAARLALAAGALVSVTSGDTAKLAQARDWGCVHGLNYRDAAYEETLKTTLRSSFDLIIDGAGGSGVGGLLNTLAPGGRFVFYGGTAGKWPAISPQRLFFKQVSLLASTMGSPADFEAMLSFVSKHRVTPIVDRTFDLEHGAEAFERLEAGTQLGKVVIRID